MTGTKFGRRLALGWYVGRSVSLHQGCVTGTERHLCNAKAAVNLTEPRHNSNADHSRRSTGRLVTRWRDERLR